MNQDTIETKVKQMKSLRHEEHEATLAQVETPAGKRSATKGRWVSLNIAQAPDGRFYRLPNRQQRRAAASRARRAK